KERIDALSAEAEDAPASRERARQAEQRLASLRTQSSGVSRLDETRGQVEAARAAEAGEAGRLPDLEAAARAADENAISMAHDHERLVEAVNRHRSEAQQAELDRVRWSE